MNSSTLSPADRRSLKARAHALDPVIMIGIGGLTDAVIAEVDRALGRHELIKIRVLGDDRDARAAMFVALAERTKAQPVQHIGKILVLYREQPEPAAVEPAKAITQNAAKRPARIARATSETRAPAKPKRILGPAPRRSRRPPLERGRPAKRAAKPRRSHS